MVVYKGAIITADKNNSIRSYLVEDKGKIVYVGHGIPEKYKDFPIVDLGEGALMPTFADTHSHFASYAMLATTVKLNKAESNQEIIALIKKADLEYPKGKTILCFGASPKVSEGRLIEKHEIDAAVSAGRKVVIICGDGHSAVLNSAALQKMPASLSKERGYHFDTGIMHQEAFYKAAGALVRIIKISDALQSFQDALDLYIESGVGLICAECASGFPLDIDVELVKWLYRGQKSGVQMRLFIQSFNVNKAKRRGIKRLGGCFETALDGSVTSQDAALTVPYENTENKGVLYYTDEQLFTYIDKINRAGMQIQMHAIGDAAVAQGVRVLKKALDAYPRKDHRHGLIHVSLISESDMETMAKYNIQVIGQPAFIELSQENYLFMYSMLGERVFAAEPHNEFIKKGINFSASSDAPVTFPSPISWVHWMVNNPNEPHRLTLQEAIKAATYNGYYSTFDEKERGSLEEGKIADMVILDKNPFNVKKENIKDIKVVKTCLGGKEWQRGDGAIKNILRGLIKNGVKL